ICCFSFCKLNTTKVLMLNCEMPFFHVPTRDWSIAIGAKSRTELFTPLLIELRLNGFVYFINRSRPIIPKSKPTRLCYNSLCMKHFPIRHIYEGYPNGKLLRVFI